jgi:dienelactone hydrolase
MAVVYLAEDLKHDRRVAIKVLSPSLAATVGSARFLREIDVVAKLQHPHILTLIDSGEAGGLPYYVMPFVEGQSLKEYLSRKGRLSVEEAVRIASEVADGLEAAHARGVIHRDVKPGNVLLSGGHAIIADFGIAAAMDEAKAAQLTDTGVSLGSPAYMSPEQASGDGEVDMRVDIYGVGCILYEMLAGKPPFEGSVKALLTQKILGRIQPLEELRDDLPAPLLTVVSKALETDPAARYPTAGELRQALLRSLPQPEEAGARRKMRAAAVAAVLVAVLSVSAVVQVRKASERELRAQQQLTEIERLVDAGLYSGALALAEQVEADFPDDTTLARLLPRFSFTVPIRSAPPGARVYMQSLEDPEDAWTELGTTPLEGVRFAGFTLESEELGKNPMPDLVWRLRFEQEGYQDRELYLTAILGVPWRGIRPLDVVELVPENGELEGMVLIPGFSLDGVEYADFYMDRFEVTNAAFRAFVDDGGYERRELWVHPFLRDGRELGFEEAVASFRDQTGRRGPSTWRLGTYPDGEADYPVRGVSWYEAAAFAEWSGKELPTTAHWNRGRAYYRENSFAIAPRSNFGGDGPRRVGENRAMTTLGVYDLVGNVREWCFNEVGPGERATRGAAWSDAPFHAGWIIPKSAFDRDMTHGMRLVRTFDDEQALVPLHAPVSQTNLRDYSTERPAADAEFELLRRLYDYDPIPLDVSVERVDTAEHWVRQVVSFDVPYGDRGGAALYLPRGYDPPYQTIVYWSGSGILQARSFDEEFLPMLDFVMRSGRAVATPMFAGTYGRPRPGADRATIGTPDPPPSSRAYRDLMIQRVKDLRTTLDYLETRGDMRTDTLGYYGFSWGGTWASVALAVEPRFTAAVLNVGGLPLGLRQSEVDAINFVTRVTVPTLMINGEHDIVFPLETSSRPMFELLGTPPEHKRHIVTPASHFVPLDELIRQTLDWFDTYLGVPTRT